MDNAQRPPLMDLNGGCPHLQRRLIEESDELSGEQHHHLLSQELCRQEQTCKKKAEGVAQKDTPVATVNYRFPPAHYVGIKKLGCFKTCFPALLDKTKVFLCQFVVSNTPADT